MPDKIRGNDAQDHVPKPGATAGGPGVKPSVPSGKQDAPNYANRVDGDGAIEVENLSSADDEGAN